MVRRHERRAEVRVPSSVASWIRAMGKRVGAPAHRVIDVLLDRYVERLPPSSRRKFDTLLRRGGGRTIQ
jgi:hypothetical protein